MKMVELFLRKIVHGRFAQMGTYSDVLSNGGVYDRK